MDKSQVPGVREITVEEIPEEDFEVLCQALDNAEGANGRVASSKRFDCELCPGLKTFRVAGLEDEDASFLRTLDQRAGYSPTEVRFRAYNTMTAHVYPTSAHDRICSAIRERYPHCFVSPVPPSIRLAAQALIRPASGQTKRARKAEPCEVLGRSNWSRLMPFQRQGVNLAVERGGRVLLADEMGMGKTLTALSIAEFYRKGSRADRCSSVLSAPSRDKVIPIPESQKLCAFVIPVLIVCPSVLTKAWVAAIRKWFPELPERSLVSVQNSTELRKLVAEAHKTNRDLWDRPSLHDYVVCSYDTLSRGGSCLLEHQGLQVPNGSSSIRKQRRSSQDGDVTFGCTCPARIATVIADECHMLRNQDTQRVRACLPILHLADQRVLLSGTPISSRPRDLLVVFHALLGEYRSKPPLCDTEFLNRYCGGESLCFRGATRVVELHNILGPLMIRRTKRNARLDLPEKARYHCVVGLSETRRECFKEALAEISDCDRGHPITRSNGAEPVQAGQHDLTSKYAYLRAMTASAKIPGIQARLRNLLMSPDTAACKLLVFARHQGMLNAVENVCLGTSTEFVRIDGRSARDSRTALVDKFQADEATRVAIVALEIGGTGLHMTAADIVFFCELDWVPGSLVQAEDRAHRIGRMRPVYIEYAVAPGTLDDWMWPVIRKKLSISSSTIDGEAACDELEPRGISSHVFRGGPTRPTERTEELVGAPAPAPRGSARQEGSPQGSFADSSDVRKRPRWGT